MFPVTPQIVAFQMAEREEEARRYHLARLAGAASHDEATRLNRGLVNRIRSYFRPSRPAATCTAACAQ